MDKKLAVERFRPLVKRLADIDKRALDIEVDVEKSTDAMIKFFETKKRYIEQKDWDTIKVIRI